MTSEQITQHFAVAALQEMDDLARQEKHEEVIDAGEELVARLREESVQPETKRHLCQCLVKVGDAMASLKRFAPSLNTYESALSLAQTFMEECSDEEMEILFKIERSLNIFGMLDRIGAAEVELKSLLVSQYLQSAKDNGAAPDLKTDSQFASKLLEKLWAATLERQQVEEQRGTPAWLDKIEKVFQNRYVQAFLFQAVIWGTGMLSMGFLIDAAKLFMRQGVPGMQAEHAAVSAEYKKIVTDKTSALSIRSLDGAQTIVLKTNYDAVLYTTKGPIQGRFIFYDGSLVSSLSAIAASNFSPSIIFQCRGCSIASQTGAVFFIDKTDDYKLVKEINRLAKKIDGFSAQNKGLPSANSNFLIYENPLHRKAQNVSVIEGVSAADLRAKLIAGSVALLENKINAADYDLVGYCQTGVPFAASRTKNGWRSRFPIQDILLPSGAEKPVFIFCEREISPITEAFRTRLVFVLAAMVISVIASIFLLREISGKFNSRHRLRKQPS